LGSDRCRPEDSAKQNAGRIALLPSFFQKPGSVPLRAGLGIQKSKKLPDVKLQRCGNQPQVVDRSVDLAQFDPADDRNIHVAVYRQLGLGNAHA